MPVINQSDVSPPFTPVEPIPVFPADSKKLILPYKQGGVYQEDVGNISPWTDSSSVMSSQSELVVTIPFSQRLAFQNRVLGYSYVQDTKLKRVLPIAHPFYEYLRCRRITRIQGLAPAGRPPQTTIASGEQLIRPYFCEYQRCRMWLNFEPLPFALKTDGQITEEYERWTWVRTEPGYESLHIDGDNFKYDTGFTIDGADISTQNAFPNGRTIPLNIARVLVTWFDVPLEFIATSAGFYTNIQAGVGTLNNAAIFGFPAYTLLMDTPQIELRPNPLPQFLTPEPSFLANVNFLFHYFDPRPLGNGVTTSLGHNMGLNRKDRKWYPVSKTQETGPNKGKGDNTTRVYPTSNYTLLFRKPT